MKPSISRGEYKYNIKKFVIKGKKANIKKDATNTRHKYTYFLEKNYKK